jgi:hypothetical protein
MSTTYSSFAGPIQPSAANLGKAELALIGRSGTHQAHLIEKLTLRLGDKLESVGDKAGLLHLCAASIRRGGCQRFCRGYLTLYQPFGAGNGH